MPLEYDPLLAKLVAWAPDRQTAIQRVLRALHEYSIVGIDTNLSFFREILNDTEFRQGDLHTNFIGEFFARRPPPAPPDSELELAAGLAAAAYSKNGQQETRNARRETSRWLADGRSELLR